MRYLVDGHNLIPKIGLRLDSVNDEQELIALLVEFSRQSRATVEVFFDGAPAGQATTKRFGRVTATFVSQLSTADEAIRQRLQKLGAEARNWIVASSDREVLAAAKAARARSMTSDALASMIRSERDSREKAQSTRRAAPRDGGEDQAEVQYWLEVFKNRKT